MTCLPRPQETGCGCDRGPAAVGLATLGEALAIVEAHTRPVNGRERIAAQSATGRVLVTPVCAHADMPAFDHAAMDGYALNTSSFSDTGPWEFTVIGRVAAGESFTQQVNPGEAVRIFTGAPIPQGSDCVVMQEKVNRTADTISVSSRPLFFENIRFRGEEQQMGAEILPSGTVLTPRSIAASAASGAGDLDVRARVRVTVLVNGREVVNAGSSAKSKAQIWDVNTPMLQSLLARPCVELLSVAHVTDDPDSVRLAISRAAETSDLIVTTGGVSVGEEDHLRPAITAANGRIHFAGVAIKPGKPVAFGSVGRAKWLGLPGNPLAAYVTWSLFGEAILSTLSGAGTGPNARRNVLLGHDLFRKPGRCEVRPARFVGTEGTGRDIVECSARVNSGQVAALARADGLVFIPAETDRLSEGDLIEFLPFSRQ